MKIEKILCSEVFLAILDNDFAVLRHFRGESSLATYLTVISRRVVVRKLLKYHTSTSLAAPDTSLESPPGMEEKRINDRDQIRRLLDGLEDREAEVIRMYHLEGRSYKEISTQVGLPENSIGPTLSRARAKLRRANADS